MFKQLGLTASALAIGGLAAATLAVTGSSGAAQDAAAQTDVVRVTARLVEQRFVDHNRPGPTLGDQFVFAADLYQRGDKVGRAGVSCTVTSRARQQFLCEGNAAFKASQIAVQGLSLRNTERFPIVGGNGRFSGASGALETHELRGNKERWIFHLR